MKFIYSATTKKSVGLGLIFATCSYAANLNRDQIDVTAWQSYSLSISATTTNPTKASSPTKDSATWRRVGDTMEINYIYTESSNSGATAGNGTYLFSLPSGYSIDTGKVYTSSDSTIHSVVGVASNQGYLGYVSAYDSTHLAMYFTDGVTTGVIGSSSYPMTLSNTNYAFFAKVPISGWSTRD